MFYFRLLWIYNPWHGFTATPLFITIIKQSSAPCLKTLLVNILTCIKLNSLQLSVVLMEGTDVMARIDNSPKLIIPKEMYISTLHTSSSFQEFSTCAWTCQHRARQHSFHRSGMLVWVLGRKSATVDNHSCEKNGLNIKQDISPFQD